MTRLGAVAFVVFLAFVLLLIAGQLDQLLDMREVWP